ncbi:hypothetical protein F4776DRAFT_609657 [Hypoxylon sp. NC0597]|nr:hypothetical protein F4776DRAFT_609657 [Hypoxylon sp. NC0597]
MTLTSTLQLEMLMEHREKDIEVLSIRTGRVTGVVGYKEPPSFFVPDAKTFAKAPLAHAGHGRGIVVGYWTHAIQCLMAAGLMPSFVAGKVMGAGTEKVSVVGSFLLLVIELRRYMVDGRV